MNIFDTSGEWNDWKWQLKNSISSKENLEQYLSLTPEEIEAFKIPNTLSFSITPYLLNQIMKYKSNNPLRKQFIPSVYKKDFHFYNADYLQEELYEKANNLIHKYYDRVALIATNYCAAYCRHCTRRRIVSQFPKNHSLSNALEYISNTPEISDVLITGGDPLILPDLELKKLLEKISTISHVKMIRIGTRVPITLPMRITENLINILKNYKSLYMNIHINHPIEITKEVQIAVSKIADAGIPLGSQSVLLRGINDSITILEKLFKQLLYLRIKPYYIYQCDKMPGCEAFWVSPVSGIKIINSLNGKLSGMAVPKYVIDTPGNWGKQIVAPCNLVNVNSDSLLLKNYKAEYTKYEYLCKKDIGEQME